MGVEMRSGDITLPSSVLPDPKRGRYSRRNVAGKVVVRKDLPKETRTYSWETPNFGDPDLGYHTVYQDRQVYPREFLPPRELALHGSLLAREGESDPTFVVRFRIDDVLDRTSESFEDDLLYDLNLLQENVGAVDVFASDASLADYLLTTTVDWEILPPGEREGTIAQLVSKLGVASPGERMRLEERYDTLMGMAPTALISGTSGFRRYFGAKFGDQLVVFENLEYGNAVYVMFEQWEELSRLSQLELMSSKREGFERIPHRAGWETRLARIVRERR